MNGAQLAGLSLAKLAQTSDGLIWQLAYHPRPTQGALRSLTIRTGRFGETAEVTPAQLAESVRALCAAVGLEDVMGTNSLDELAKAKEREAKEIDASIAEREREFELEIAELRAGQIRARLEAKELRKAADRIASRLTRVAGGRPSARGGGSMAFADQILEALAAKPNDTFTRPALAEVCGTAPQNLSPVLTKLVQDKRIRRVEHGVYQHAPARKGKAA
ncbi:MAG: hypothetical protein SF182_01510 [Deltaproteobacteria bacterium]|nr:hypothetical protein [Deltaproteobacteria bacterium]